jgi:hypothetical protein
MIAVSQASAEQGYVVRGDNPWLILAIIAVIVLACVLAPATEAGAQRPVVCTTHPVHQVSEARVPHDPADLRDAAKACVLVAPAGSISRDEWVKVAHRLEAWADDLERLAPLEAAVLDAAKKLVEVIWREQECFDPVAGPPGLVDVWNRCTVLSARLRALQEATER